MNEQKPRHIASAEMLARRSGLTGSQLLDEIQALALSPDYPTPDCFLPNEIWDFERTGTMPNGRLAHADECVNCKALLSALSPDPLLIEEVASLAGSRYSGSADRAHLKEPREHKHSAAIVAVAAILLIGFALLSWGLRSAGSMTADQPNPQRSVAFASALFTVTNEDNNDQLSIPVKTHADGRLQEGSYSAAAAATALVSSPVLAVKQGDRDIPSGDPSTKYLRVLLVSALADSCENSKRKQGDVTGLEHRLRKAQLNVQTISSSNDQWLIRYGVDSVTLKPDEALSNTMQYCIVLSRHNGDTRALDRSLQNVDINLAAVKDSSPPE